MDEEIKEYPLSDESPEDTGMTKDDYMDLYLDMDADDRDLY